MHCHIYVHIFGACLTFSLPPKAPFHGYFLPPGIFSLFTLPFDLLYTIVRPGREIVDQINWQILPSAVFYNVTGVPVNKIAYRLPSVVTLIGALQLSQKFVLLLGIHSTRQNFVDDLLVRLGLWVHNRPFVVKK